MQNVCSILYCHLACQAVPNVSALSHKWHWFFFWGGGNSKHFFFFNFSATFVATFLILRIIYQDIVKCLYAVMLSSCSSCQILLKLEFSQHIF
jgi:hypothetical protein